MTVVAGVIVALLAVLAWLGQTISAVSPDTAVRFGLAEAEDAVDPVFWADIRGEAKWDIFTLWTMIVAGVLLATGSGAWAYFGLVGGGTYAYFGGRGLWVRYEMQRRGLRIGTPGSVRVAMAALAVWGVMGVAVAIASVAALNPT